MGAYSCPISSALVLAQDINMGAALPKVDGKVAPKLGVAADSSEKTQFLESAFTRRLQVIGLFDYSGRNEYNGRNTPVAYANYIGAILAVYSCCRYALQFASEKYVTVDKIAFLGVSRLVLSPMLCYNTNLSTGRS